MNIYSQYKNEEQRIEYANELFENKRFIEAEPHMLHILSIKNNAEYSFKYGVCALYTYPDKSKALRFLSHAIKKDRNVDARAYFYLGKAFHLNYRFADAIKNYEKFIDKATDKQLKKIDVQMHINMCNSGKSLMKQLTDLVVEEKIQTKINNFQYSYDLSQIGGTILMSEEFQTKLDKKKGYRSVIYFPPIGNNVIFYSSYGNDGKTGLDIYRVKRLPSGDWSESIKLPNQINTKYDDAFPFLHSDGKSFYFCSKGHNSMGAYDVFKCMYDDETFSFGQAVNLDYKINTPDDDIMYVVDPTNTNAFFSSSRSSKGGFLDVYKVKVEAFPIQNVIIAGTFTNEINTADFKASIKVKELTSDEIIGVYSPNDERKYTILLPHSGKYKFIVETPESQKIHSGLVEVSPQKELIPLKQEILLVDRGGNEQLVIKNLFNESVDNQSEI